MSINQFLYSPDFKTLTLASASFVGFRKIYPKQNPAFWYSMDENGFEKQIAYRYALGNGLTEMSLPASSVNGFSLSVAIGNGLGFDGNNIIVSGLTPSMLNTLNSGTSGFYLSVTGSSFQWVPPTTGISGTTNTIAKLVSNTTIGDSRIIDDVNGVYIGTVPIFTFSFSVAGPLNTSGPIYIGNQNYRISDAGSGVLDFIGNGFRFSDPVLPMDYLRLLKNPPNYTFSILNNLIEIGSNTFSGVRYISAPNLSNVDLGTTSGTFSLNLWGVNAGVIRISDGNQLLGRVLTSDNNGVATWRPVFGITAGVQNFIPVYTGLNTLTSSGVYQGLTSRTIVIGYTQGLSQFDTGTMSMRVGGNVFFDLGTASENKFYLNNTWLFDDFGRNIALGSGALRGNTQSVGRSNNISIGSSSMISLISGTSNIGIGNNTMINSNTVSENISIGDGSLRSVQSSGNISIGHLSGVSYSTTDVGSWGLNVFLGDNSAQGFSRGSLNTFITSNVSQMGTPSNIGITFGSNNIVLGQRITISQSSTTGNVIIGNSMSVRGGLTNSIIIADGFGNERIFVDERGNMALGTQSSSHRLTIWRPTGGTASFRLVDSFQSRGRVLISDANGVGTWGNLSLTRNISENYTILLSDYGTTFEVTTSNNLITLTPPSGLTFSDNGFEFVVKKIDGNTGAVLLNGIYEFQSGGGNFSYITRLNQAVKYVWDGTNWITIYIDEGALPSNTIYGNLGGTFSHGDYVPIVDVNDSIQETFNYQQGSFRNDWFSGTIFSAYQPINLFNPATQSMFNTASNSFIGSTSSPLTIPSFSLKVGKSFRIQLFGTYSVTNATFSIVPRLNTTNISTTTLQGGPSSSTSAIPFYIDYVIKCLSVGPSGSLYGSGIWVSRDNPIDANRYQNIWSSSVTSINTATANQIGFITNRPSGGTYSMTVIHSTIERLA